MKTKEELRRRYRNMLAPYIMLAPYLMLDRTCQKYIEKERKEKERKEKIKLNRKKRIRDKMTPIIKETIKVGEIYPRAYIKIELQKIYTEFKYPEKAKATDLVKYYNYEVTIKNFKNEDGVNVSCFIL